jgi:hypothetical protein
MKDHRARVPYSDKANLMAAKGQIGRGSFCLTKTIRKATSLKMAGWIKQTARGPLISALKKTLGSQTLTTNKTSSQRLLGTLMILIQTCRSDV